MVASSSAPGALQEERHRVAAPAAAPHRVHPVQREEQLAGEPQPLARGDQRPHPGGGGQQAAHQLRALGEVLEVVEEEEQPLLAQEVEHRGQRVLAAGGGEAQRGGDGGGHQLHGPHPGQRHHADAVGEAGARAGRRLERQARLPHPPRPGDGDQAPAGLRQPRRERGELGGAAHEGGGLREQVVDVRGGGRGLRGRVRLAGGGGAGAAVAPHLEEPRPREHQGEARQRADHQVEGRLGGERKRVREDFAELDGPGGGDRVAGGGAVHGARVELRVQRAEAPADHVRPRRGGRGGGRLHADCPAAGDAPARARAGACCVTAWVLRGGLPARPPPRRR